MEFLLSYGLFAIGIVEIVLGLQVIFKESKSVSSNWLFFCMCVGASMWSISFAILATSDFATDTVRYIIRAALLIGISICISMCISLLVIWLEMTKKARVFINSLLLILAAVAVPCGIDFRTAQFVKTGYGWTYLHCYSPTRIIYTVYLFALFAILIILIGYGYLTGKKKRIRFISSCALACFFIFVIGTGFDVWSQFFGKPVFPASAIGMFFVVLLIYVVTIRMTVNRITVTNIAEDLFNLVDMPMFIVDENGMICYVNDTALMFVAMSEEQVVKKSLSEFFFMELETMDTAKNRVRGVSMFEMEASCKQNGAKCRIRISHVMDVFGEHLADIIVVSDMTDQIMLIEELKKSKEQAEKSDAATSSFLANISHEMRVPMNVILGMSEIAMTGKGRVKLSETIRSINRAGHDLMDIINDVLDLSKINSGRYEVVPNAYSLVGMIQHAVEIIKTNFYGKQVMFFAEINPKLPEELIGDEKRILQIITNLLTNAVKFTDSGYVRMYVDGHFDEGTTGVLNIEVSDTGRGIKREDISKMFELYTQVDPQKNGEVGATGLGLTISKRLASLMGGDITVESVYGKGSVFNVTIRQNVINHRTLSEAIYEKEKSVLFVSPEPVFMKQVKPILNDMGIKYQEEDDVAEAAAENADYVIITAEHYMAHADKVLAMVPSDKLVLLMKDEYDMPETLNDIKRMMIPMFSIQLVHLLNNGYIPKQFEEEAFVVSTQYPSASVLVVDDSITSLRVASGLLQPYCMNVDVATGGAEAVERVREKKYDLIFMDYMMPMQDGVETVNQIRSLGEDYKDIPVVALTANALSGTKKFFMDKGYNGYMSKPILGRELDKVLKEFLQDGITDGRDYAK